MIVNSKATLKMLVGKMKFSNKKIIVANNGVDANKFRKKMGPFFSNIISKIKRKPKIPVPPKRPSAMPQAPPRR